MRRPLAAALAALPLLFVTYAGCANQGIGERCNILAGNNGDDDCNTGLTCVPPGQLQWPARDGGRPQATTTGICCPRDPAQRAVQTGVCGMTSSMFDLDASIPEGGGADVIEGGAQDASQDASQDVSDGSSDAAEGGG